MADKEYRKRHKDWKQTKLAARVAAGRKRLVFLSLNGMHHHRKMVEVGKGWALERQYRLTRAAMKARNGKPERAAKPTSKTKPRRKPAKPANKAATLPSKETTPASSQEVKS